MFKVPLISRCNLSLQFVIEALALVETLLGIGLFEVLIVEIVDLSLILLNQVLHSMKRLNVPKIFVK